MTPDDKDALTFVGCIAGWSFACFVAGGIVALYLFC
jgi:hypothetical protein